MEKTVLANSLLTEQEGEVSALSEQLTDHFPLDNDYEVLSEGIFSQPGDTRQTSLVIKSSTALAKGVPTWATECSPDE